MNDRCVMVENIVKSNIELIRQISKLEYLSQFNLYDGLIDLDNKERGGIYGIN